MTYRKVQARRERVAELTRDGHGANKIADMLGVTARTIGRDRRALGISIPPQPPTHPDLLAAAQRLLDDGASYAESARTVGVSWHCVARHFPGRGWDKRTGGELGRLRRYHGGVLQ